MKKLYFWFAALMALFMTSVPVSADDDMAVFNWTEPGSVNFYAKLADKAAGKTIDLPAGATQFSFTGDEVFVAPAEGYVITEMKASDGGTIKIVPGNYQEKYGQVITVSYGSLWGKTYDIKVEKIVRDKKLNIKVANGTEYVNAKFKEYWTPVALKKGNNEVAFSSLFEKTLAIQNVAGTSVKKIYQVKRNGNVIEDVSSPGYSYFELKNITESDEIEIRVFEDDEPEIETCEISLSIAAGIEDCVKSVFNKTTGTFVTVADNKFTVDKGNELQFNFAEDITFTSFSFGGKDVTSLYNKENNRLVVTAEGDATLVIAGVPTVYNDIEFTVYVMNPEGARLRLGSPDSLNEADLSRGETISSTFTTPPLGYTNIAGVTTTIPSVKMTPENTRKFTVKVSEKRPNIFISPIQGYYINGVFDSELKDMIEYVTPENRVFYVVAQKMNRVGKATVVVDGSEDVRLTPSAGLSMLWSNPASSFGIGKGSNEITFDPVYHTPFTFRAISDNDDFIVEDYEVYLDGMRISPDDNGLFPIDFALPAYDEATGWQPMEKGSTLHAYAYGSTAPTCGFSVIRNDNYDLDVFYSEMRRPAPDSFSAEQGTKITVRPDKEARGYLLKVGNETVYGFDDIDQAFINRLENGEYTMTAPKVGAMQISISKDEKASSGVELIGAAADAEIFNLQGIAVGNDLNPLPAGVYIRNGKKIIKR